MTPPLQLISTDFDGTLHAEFEHPPVPTDLQRLIGELQRQGAKWVINTGRPLASLMEAVARARLSIKPDYVVTVEREIYRHENLAYVPSLEWNRACAAAHQELFARVRPDVPRLMEQVRARFRATLYEDDYSPFCMIAESNEQADAIEAFLQDYCAQVPGLAVVRNDVYARFSHVAFNKGTTLAAIARELGAPPERVFAAGDHLNDLPMLSAAIARCLAAPANAVPQVKEAVRRQGGSVSHQPCGHGVARGLEHFLNGGGGHRSPPVR